ncbi:undecaprenyl-phosphate galactose phosphotransferase WbaP [Alcaligenaceae bacterium]|nr:undecaprenyl-phosphate galactose phosphotransferase WbaP [Alcaligenaceae bacterium]
MIKRQSATTNINFRASISKVVLTCTDFVLFNAAPWIAAGMVYLLWGNLSAYIPSDEIQPRLSAHLMLSMVCVLWFWLRLRHYTYRKPFWFELKEVLRTIIVFAVIDLAIVAFSKLYVSRYLWVFTWSSALVLIPLGRIVAKTVLARLDLWAKQSVIIGTGPNAKDAYHAITSERSMGFDVQYFFGASAPQPDRLLNLPVLTDQNTLWRTTDPRNTQFFVAVEYEEERQREYWIKNLATHHCRAVSVIPTTSGIPLNSTDMSFIFSHEVLILRVNNNLTKRSARILKRSFDITGSLLIMLLLSPVLLGLALYIRRDGGRAFYGHERVGRNGRKFKCWKYRSMVVNASDILMRLLADDAQARAEWEKDFKLKNDPRITRVGAFIRRTSMDELPQLWNVLKGEMSLVGPRPIVAAELERYADDADYYLMAKPGMTGLWQVSGRNDVDYDKRVYFDAWYVKNWSLWNDIAILFKTVNVVLKRDGAY